VWALLSKATELPVVAVPGRPDVAKLVYGQVKSGDDLSLSPTQKMLLFIGVGLFCLFLLVAAALSWRGIDIDFDSQTGKFSLKRYGEGR